MVALCFMKCNKAVCAIISYGKIMEIIYELILFECW